MELVITLAGFVGIFLNLGMNNAVQRFYWDPSTKESERPNIVSTGLWILVSWAVFLTILILSFLYIFNNDIYSKYNISWEFLLLGLIVNVPSQILQYVSDTLRLHFLPWKFTTIQLIKNMAGVILGFYFILVMKQGLMGYFLGNIIALSIAIPYGLFTIKKDITLSIDKSKAKELVSFGYPFIFAGMAYWVFGSMDRWMLGTLSDNVQVGLYSIAFKFSFFLTFVNSSFSQAWSPFAIKIYKERKDYKEIYSKVLNYLFFGLIFLGAGLSLFAYEILRVLTPDSYWPAANIIGFLSAGIVFYGTTQVTAIGISLKKRTSLLSFAAWATAILNLVLNYFMIGWWQALGAAVATLISYFFLSIFYLYWAQKLDPIPLDKLKLSLLSTLLVIVLILSFYLNSLDWSINLLPAKLVILLSILLIGYKSKLLPIISIINILNFKSLLKKT
jgi:O-antigen/teichoic acid export membrane protein